MSRALLEEECWLPLNLYLQGQNFLWNYGPQEVKLIPSVELRPKEAREFIKREKIGELAECLETLKRGENQSFQDFVRAEKFRYILRTPFNLFRMVFDGSIEAGKAARIVTVCCGFRLYPLCCNRTA